MLDQILYFSIKILSAIGCLVWVRVFMLLLEYLRPKTKTYAKTILFAILLITLMFIAIAYPLPDI